MWKFRKRWHHLALQGQAASVGRFPGKGSELILQEGISLDKLRCKGARPQQEKAGAQGLCSRQEAHSRLRGREPTSSKFVQREGGMEGPGKKQGSDGKPGSIRDAKSVARLP